MRKHISPDDEEYLSKCSQPEWEAFCNKNGLGKIIQKTLLSQIGRRDLNSVSTTPPPSSTIISTPLVTSPLNQKSIYEHYLSMMDPKRAAPLRSSIEACKRRMNKREVQKSGAEHDSVQSQHYGLVVGRIQSGKTGHMIGLTLLCLSNPYILSNEELRHDRKSASVVVIFTGLIDDLRRQTYDRIHRDISGYDLKDVIIGPSRENDLTQNKQFQEEIQDFFSDRKHISKQLVLVLKKNHKVIEKLIEILDGVAEPRKRHLGDVIVIDDECDYASMDANNADQDMKASETTTNLQLRTLLATFRNGNKFKTHCWYIGYTATPFSNILTNPHGVSSEGYPTLFPRGFIYSIPKVPVHFDNEFYFNDDEGADHVFFIEEAGGGEEE
tara:strand:- start:2948 stop:4096 length:1149 start_codon:yes stop_codon:yes gene_type:complete